MALLKPVEAWMTEKLQPQLPLPDVGPFPTLLQPCSDAGEPLIRVEPIPFIDAYAELDILERRFLRVRLGVRERLIAANVTLPDGFSLVLLDGWRSMAEQQRLVDYYSDHGDIDGWVSDPSSPVLRPPHTTGGAVDVSLSYNGVPLALGSDFDEFDVSAHLMYLEQVESPERELRRLLAAVLSGQGFAPYPFEWWHWSYGDDMWAAKNALPALYDVLDG